MLQPTISVVMPAYNHEKFVAEAISSVLEQTFGDLELIVVNDGSTDATGEVIQSFTDLRLRYLEQPNQGAHHALNRGIAAARGRYIAILNSDDVFAPNRLEVLLARMERDNLEFLVSDIQLIGGDSLPIEDAGHWWVTWYEGLKQSYPSAASPAAALLAGNYAITSSNFFFRAGLTERIGLFRPFRYILDYDFAFRAASACSSGFAFLIGEKLLRYRLHGHNTISENPIKANIETFYFLKKAMRAYFGDALDVPLRHLSKIKGYMLKIENAKRYAEIHRMGGELHALHVERDALFAQINDLHGQVGARDLQIAGLAGENGRLGGELERVGHELALVRRSASFRLGWALTAPLRWLRGLAPARRGALRLKARDVTELRTGLEQALGGVKVVSFDIFDTLLERDIDPPDTVKWVVARRVARMLTDEFGMPCTAVGVMELRNGIEDDLRRQATNAGMDHECRFSDIARGLAALLSGKEDEALAARIVDHELRAETEVLFVKRDMARVLEWINSRGIRVIAVSDMYLDRAHLQHIFASKGLHAHFDEIYVSSEAGVGKYSGRLFEHVLEREGLQPGEMLHIGDNRHSDYRSPARMGIHAIHFDDEESMRRRVTLGMYHRLAAQNPYWCGRHLLQIVRPPESRGFHYDYGYRVLGPIYAAFTLGVIERLKQDGIRDVYFLAREGELFMRLFQALAPGFFSPEHLPRAHYLYVSRRSTSTASAHRGLAWEPAIVPLFNPKQEGLYSICNAFGLPVAEFAEVSRKHGYASVKQPIYDWHSAQFKGMLADPEFQEIVRRHAGQSWSLLRQYLAQEGFFAAGQAALVDIGWNGSIQKFFQEAFGDDPDCPHIHGLYLAFIGGIKHSFSADGNTITGVLCDERGKARPQDIFSRFEEIFEEGARALHPTTLAYRLNEESGRVEPVLKQENALDRVAELRSNQRIAQFQEGVMDFAAEFGRALDLTGYGFEDIKPFILTLAERAVAYPTPDEIHELMQLAHSEDFGYENVMDFRHEQLGGWRALLRPRRLRRQLAVANWKYGTAGSLGIPGINMAVRFYDLLKER